MLSFRSDRHSTAVVGHTFYIPCTCDLSAFILKTVALRYVNFMTVSNFSMFFSILATLVLGDSILHQHCN